MTEEFVKFIWKNRLFDQDDLHSTNGDAIEIQKVGFSNSDAGPDFYDARIKIDETLWAGNVEVHIQSSDWYNHNHHKDPGYNNVILHVVLIADKETKTLENRVVPTLQLQVDESFYANYQSLMNSDDWLLCRKELQEISGVVKNIWLDRLAIQRLEKRIEHVQQIYESTKMSYEDTFYILIARNFGFTTNSLPFEMLAKSLPLKVLAKHKNSLTQIEALLFGQAGFLNDFEGDDYYIMLKKEYDFLKIKYKLQPLEKHLWKFLRLRPVNFPTIRIAQFAHLIYKSSALFSKIIETNTVHEIQELFNINASEYWTSHYQFNKTTNDLQKHIGKVAINGIIINTIVPLVFFYGRNTGSELITEKALRFLEILKSEKNSIITSWFQAGFKSENASNSQALIELRNEYCKFKKCLYCDIGRNIILAK